MSFLPACPGYTGDLPVGSIFAEAQTAHAESAHIGSGAPADQAAVILSDLKLGNSLLLDF